MQKTIMSKPSRNKVIGDISTSIGGNMPLASSIYESISSALKSGSVHLVEGKTELDIFQNSLDAAIRNIENHPRGKLFRRLIEYGPLNPDDPKKLTSDGETTLSDPECVKAVYFIFSHMVNRFKGELAELLAVKPCIELTQQLKTQGHFPSGIQVYWGDTIKERRRLRAKGRSIRWGSYTKGADGMIVQEKVNLKNKLKKSVDILGIVEVKSMNVPMAKLKQQIDTHAKRLRGGAILSQLEYSPRNITLKKSDLIRIIVKPSTWKLSREWRLKKGANGNKVMIFPEPSDTPQKTYIKKLEKNLFMITLGWSKEALEQAAYEMTFHYMSQVGRHVFTGKKMPKGWKKMSPEEAGYNAIKMMLYYIPLRYISERQVRLATKLYNVYSFGYPLGVDSKEMLWPEDFAQKPNEGDIRS